MSVAALPSRGRPGANRRREKPVRPGGRETLRDEAVQVTAPWFSTSDSGLWGGLAACGPVKATDSRVSPL